KAGEEPRLRPARSSAGRHRRGAVGPARPDLDWSAGQSSLSRLWTAQRRAFPDPRPREAVERAEGAHGGEPALSRGRPPRHVAVAWRAHVVSAAADAASRIREISGGGGAGFGHDG